VKCQGLSISLTGVCSVWLHHDEIYRVAFRKKVYRSIDEMQPDLDAWVAEYNAQRRHQGR
jgi:hypothetical protein